MKLKISESKIRQIINEEVLKQRLNKTIKEQKWPSYTAYLGAEILKLEWDKKLQENNNLNLKPSPEWIAETASAFGLGEAEIAEATEIMENPELEEGAKGFFKAVAKPFQNIWQTFSNITQHAANLTDPEAKTAAKPIAQATEKLPEPEELQQQAEESPESIEDLIKQLMDLLRKVDQASDSDDIKPGLEDTLDQQADDLEQAAQQGIAAAGGEEAGGAGKEAFVFRGKGGKGLQSFLSRGASTDGVSLKGPAMGAVLKHIEKQLKAQGVTVNEGVLDEVQGWIWYGLVESLMQEHYGAPVTLQQILNEINFPDSDRDERQSRQSQKKQALIRQAADKRRAELAAKKGGGGDVTAAALGDEEEEAAPEEVESTVQNTAPEDAPLIKVFKGKGGEGLQSALARSRDKLGIDQRTVASIIKSVEKWAQANQIRVENITEDVFDSILTELSAKYRARKLEESINKLKS